MGGYRCGDEARIAPRLTAVVAGVVKAVGVVLRGFEKGVVALKRAEGLSGLSFGAQFTDGRRTDEDAIGVIDRSNVLFRFHLGLLPEDVGIAGCKELREGLYFGAPIGLGRDQHQMLGRHFLQRREALDERVIAFGKFHVHDA